MNPGVSLIASGFSLIDENWGGIYRGGSYVIVGPRKSGRTLMGLQIAAESAKSSEICLYFTNMRPKDLMIQAASLNFDIQSSMNKNLIIVVRVAPPNEIYEVPNPDEYLVEYMNDIITVVNQYNPSRIVFDELTQYVGFHSLDRLHNTFLSTLETIEERNITSFFIVGEPATERAQQLINVISRSVTANIYLKKHAEKIDGKFHGGMVVIVPNVGHTEGQFSAQYIIEPYKGVTTLTAKLKRESEVESAEPVSGQRSAVSAPVDAAPQVKDAKPETTATFSNNYNFTDFQLILNNQIALFNSTGQSFNLVSFKLDPAAQVKGLLSLNQLQNSFSLSVSKKDKICTQDNKILVLIVRSTPNSLSQLVKNLRNSLPSKDDHYFKAVSEYINLSNLEVNENYHNAEDMLNPILQESSNIIYQPILDYA
ncbi:MAG: ATPase domain-containing protein [Bacteroidota bacterium]